MSSTVAYSHLTSRGKGPSGASRPAQPMNRELKQRDIAPAEPARVAELEAKIDKLLVRRTSTWGKAPVVQLEEMKDQLRKLGYVVE